MFRHRFRPKVGPTFVNVHLHSVLLRREFVSPAVTIAIYLISLCLSLILILMHYIQVEFESVSDVACLENENLVKYAITRALHLQEIFNLVAQKYDKKNLNVVEFPYYWVKGYSFLLR